MQISLQETELSPNIQSRMTRPLAAGLVETQWVVRREHSMTAKMYKEAIIAAALINVKWTLRPAWTRGAATNRH